VTEEMHTAVDHLPQQANSRAPIIDNGVSQRTKREKVQDNIISLTSVQLQDNIILPIKSKEATINSITIRVVVDKAIITSHKATITINLNNKAALTISHVHKVGTTTDQHLLVEDKLASIVRLLKEVTTVKQMLVGKAVINRVIGYKAVTTTSHLIGDKLAVTAINEVLMLVDKADTTISQLIVLLLKVATIISLEVAALTIGKVPVTRSTIIDKLQVVTNEAGSTNELQRKIDGKVVQLR